MDNPILLEELFWRFLGTIVFGLGIVPAAGGAIIWKTFQIAKIPNFTFGQCWRAYLGGCAYAYVLFMVINIVRGTSQGLELLQLLLFIGIPFVVVPLFLRNFSRRVLAVEAIALVIINALVLLFVFVSRLH
ncbi:MAG TPA: hypothetical protein VGX70_10935 [Gemmataceae bacterium]|jgi:hypothetical protein|nr:hypothetical protein [Gemmataceae bacterium]